MGRSDNTRAVGKWFSWLSAVAAFFVWGSWAYFINAGAGPSTRLLSAFTQGLASLLITLFMVHAVTRFYRLITQPRLRLLLPGVLTVTVTGCFLATVHTLAGTPKILLTISPALSVALVFCLITTRRLAPVNPTSPLATNSNKENPTP